MSNHKRYGVRLGAYHLCIDKGLYGTDHRLLLLDHPTFQYHSFEDALAQREAIGGYGEIVCSEVLEYVVTHP